MTDAFRCNGCGAYYDDDFRFVGVWMDTDVLATHPEHTLDDIETPAYGILEDSGDGDFCPKCGIDALEDLVERFRGEE